MRINEKQYTAACQVASNVFDRQLTRAEGVRLLTAEHGICAGSGGPYIDVYNHLMNGTVFKRHMGAEAMRFFMLAIFQNRKAERQANAVASLRKHITYWEGHYKRRCHEMGIIAGEFETALSAPPTTSLEVNLE